MTKSGIEFLVLLIFLKWHFEHYLIREMHTAWCKRRWIDGRIHNKVLIWVVVKQCVWWLKYLVFRTAVGFPWPANLFLSTPRTVSLFVDGIKTRREILCHRGKVRELVRGQGGKMWWVKIISRYLQGVFATVLTCKKYKMQETTPKKCRKCAKNEILGRVLGFFRNKIFTQIVFWNHNLCLAKFTISGR